MKTDRILAGALLLLTIDAAVLSAGNAPGNSGVTAAASRELNLPDSPVRYVDELPAHFQTPAAKAFDDTPGDNPLTDAGALLGRVLFYDTRLSASGTVSCGSCHQQRHAFADPRRFSRGHAGQDTDRNSMSLVNLRYSKAGKFWDERAKTLEAQVLIPMQSPVEMGQDLDARVKILQGDERYRGLFEGAFGDPAISSERMANALGQFLLSLVSYRSIYDAAPYILDGRFHTLYEVIEHYSTGVKLLPNVSGFVFRMQFSD
jgi:cytochrome c peroxidase